MLPRSACALAIACSFVMCVTGVSAQKRGPGGGPAGAGIEPLTTVRVASGLNRPVYATHAPGDFSRLFIVEQRGVIKILDLPTATILPTPFLDIDSLVSGPSGTYDERGLLGLAFHPDYQSNGYFYVNYTNNSSNTTIRRYTVSADPDVADPASGFTLLTIDQPFSNHNGGWLDFGPNDGYLYIATGDGGYYCDPGQRSQDITNQLLGKMLRIDVDGGIPYAIPPDNPFVGITAMMRSGPTACGTPGGRASTPPPATCTWPMSARTPGRRSTFSRHRAPAERIMVGTAWKETIARRPGVPQALVPASRPR